jgi:hypothetical protein
MNLESYNAKKLYVVEWVNPKWASFNYMVFDNKEDAVLFFNDLSDFMNDKTINKLSINKIKKTEQSSQ